MIWLQLQYTPDIIELSDFINRVVDDGGVVNNGGNLPLWFQIAGFSPSLFCPCDSGKEGVLYSLIP
jgi:hypothetical protein